MKQTNRIQVRRTIGVEPNRVFKAFTRPDLMGRWFFSDRKWSAHARTELKEGGEFYLAMTSPEGDTYEHHGKFMEIQRPNRISFTWNSELVVGTHVLVELMPIMNGGTEIIITHSGFDKPEQAEKHKEGWATCLRNLEAAFDPAVPWEEAA